METITKSTEETFEVGRRIGADLKGGEIIALIGEMGAGKTTFVQGLAKGLGVKNKIVSPTFILMRSYMGKLNLYHLDLYRLEGNIEDHVKNLGLFDIWRDEKNVVVVEWAEKIQNILPKETIWIKFESIDEDQRKISL